MPGDSPLNPPESPGNGTVNPTLDGPRTSCKTAPMSPQSDSADDDAQQEDDVEQLASAIRDRDDRRRRAVKRSKARVHYP